MSLMGEKPVFPFSIRIKMLINNKLLPNGCERSISYKSKSLYFQFEAEMSSSNNVINVFKYFGAQCHGKKFPKMSQTSFSVIVYCNCILKICGEVR